MGTAILITAGVFIGVLLLIGLGLYPVFAIVECGISKKRSDVAKVLWIVVMVLVWPIAALIYGIFVSANKVIRWAGVVSFIVLFMFCVSFVYGGMWVIKEATKQIQQMGERVESAQAPSLSNAQVQGLVGELDVLKSEIKGMRLRKPELIRGYKALILLRMMAQVLDDQKIGTDEFSRWKEKFTSREVLDARVLNEYVEELVKANK